MSINIKKFDFREEMSSFKFWVIMLLIVIILIEFGILYRIGTVLILLFQLSM